MLNNPDNQHRRATDHANMPEGAAPTPENIWKLLLEIRDRVATMEGLHGSQSEAFVKDDLGKPDYHGHRKAHLKQIKDAEIVDNYKVDATKKIIGTIAVFLMGLIAAGALEHIKTALLGK